MHSKKNQQISPLAVVESGARLGHNVVIEPFAVVKANVVLEDDVTIKSHAYLDGYTTVGQGTVIYPFASIGTNPQALKYQGERTYVRIGKRCCIREYVTINSSLGQETAVEVGDDCFLMSYCHIAHNCVLGKGVIMANSATLAGHVTIEDHAIVGGMTPLHQHVRVGRYAMVGGFSRVPLDIPPYTLGAGVPYKLAGLNMVGLKRNGFSLEVRKSLTRAFRLIFRSSLKLEDALDKIEDEIDECPEVRHLVDFCRQSKRGIICANIKSNQESNLEEMAHKSQKMTV